MRGKSLLLGIVGALALSASTLATGFAGINVTLETSLGNIVLELDPVHAPRSVANFLRYVAEKHFDNTLFYRVEPGFVIQAGSYGADGVGRATHDPIPLEANNGLKNVRGAISMARTDDPNSADAEFFIVLADNPALDHQSGDPGNATGYAVFGHVVEGMDVVDKIAMVPRGGEGPFPAASPKTPVVIRRALQLPPP
jgi:cyclophilin family peptidyl-prolyl cis-trans isomerase